jgi:hypothetical protein
MSFTLLTLFLAVQATPSETQLPTPTGVAAVGTLSFHWIDESRLEGGTADPADFRELPAQVWYPALSAPGGEPAPYLDEPATYASVYRPETIAKIEELRTNARLAAEPAEGGPYPVVLLSHGWQCNRAGYTAFIEDLASHGFVVVGIDHPFLGFARLGSGEITAPSEDHFKSQAETMACYGGDQVFVLDRLAELNADHAVLAGLMDLERVGTIGHSSGVIAAAGATQSDPRIKACVLIEGFSSAWVFDRPLLVLRTERTAAPGASYAARASAPVYDADVRGANHVSCMDAPFVWASTAEERERALANLRTTSHLARAFFERFLKDDPTALDGLADELPAEVTLTALTDD